MKDVDIYNQLIIAGVGNWLSSGLLDYCAGVDHFKNILLDSK